MIHLPQLVKLLAEDELGQNRELVDSEILDARYLKAFQQIDSDRNQYLMIIEDANEIVGTCHLTIMPSLTFIGSPRMQIEAVRIAAKHRGQGIGRSMFEQAISYAKAHHISIVQLSTNKARPEAKRFYTKLGFQASHEGMKLLLK